MENLIVANIAKEFITPIALPNRGSVDFLIKATFNWDGSQYIFSTLENIMLNYYREPISILTDSEQAYVLEQAKQACEGVAMKIIPNYEFDANFNELTCKVEVVYFIGSNEYTINIHYATIFDDLKFMPECADNNSPALIGNVKRTRYGHTVTVAGLIPCSIDTIMREYPQVREYLNELIHNHIQVKLKAA